MGLFQKAAPEQRRLKMYIYGAQGTGKTVTSLHMPAPAVIDMDGGTDWYSEAFEFQRLRTTDIDKVYQSVDDLIKDPTGVKTLVLDSMTKFWELLQEKHLKRMRVKKGNPQYVFQPVDYKVIKSDLKSLINKLLALDLNIVVTAQSKTIFSQDPGEFMKAIGTEPDGPKEAPYLFDVVIELTLGENDKRIATVKKDRTNTLPKQFDFTYQELVKHFGVKELERDPVKLRQEQAMNKIQNRTLEITVGTKKLMTAGVTADTLQKLATATKHLTDEALRDKLNEDYSVQTLLDLREDEARTLLNDLATTATANTATATSTKTA